MAIEGISSKARQPIPTETAITAYRGRWPPYPKFGSETLMMPQTNQRGMKGFISYVIEASGRNRKACQAHQREQVKEAG